MILTATVLMMTTLSGCDNKKKTELIAELEPNAQRLVTANFDAASYFAIAQLTPAEYYDTEVYEDGTAPCNADIFADYASLESFVKDTYVPDEAARILALTVDGKPRYYDKDGVLCKTSAPTDTTYNKDLSALTYHIENATEETADIIVTVPLKDSEEKQAITLHMVKSDGKWLLSAMKY